MKSILIYLLTAIVIFSFFSCGKNSSQEDKNYISQIEKSRKEKDDYMKNNPSSPFNHDPEAHFAPLKYYKVDPDFVFRSKLNENVNKDTVKIYGTKGEERKVVKFGYVIWNFKNEDHKINVYKGVTRNGQEYYSIWFTDKTTGKETYGVGRYLDFEMMTDPNYTYTIDFNLAYSPYCSYSTKYSCAIPAKEDYIDVAIKAGEKSFH